MDGALGDRRTPICDIKRVTPTRDTKQQGYLRHQQQENTLEYVKITQTRGPTIKLNGEILAEKAFTRAGRDRPVKVTLIVYEASTGEYVAHQETRPLSGEGYRSSRAEVFAQPIIELTVDGTLMDKGDAQAEIERQVQRLHFSIMDFFEWDNHARSMAREQLGWDLEMDLRAGETS